MGNQGSSPLGHSEQDSRTDLGVILTKGRGSWGIYTPSPFGLWLRAAPTSGLPLWQVSGFWHPEKTLPSHLLAGGSHEVGMAHNSEPERD